MLLSHNWDLNNAKRHHTNWFKKKKQFVLVYVCSNCKRENGIWVRKTMGNRMIIVCKEQCNMDTVSQVLLLDVLSFEDQYKDNNNILYEVHLFFFVQKKKYEVHLLLHFVRSSHLTDQGIGTSSCHLRRSYQNT